MRVFLLFLFVHAYSGLLGLGRYAARRARPTSSGRQPWLVKERFRLPSACRDFRNHTVVWLHASSLGESRVLLEYLRIFNEKHPDDLYVVTAATLTGVDYLSRHKHKAMASVGLLPADTIPLMKGMLGRFSVSRVWLIETELWPSMLWVCRSAGVPVGIANARMEEKSFRRYQAFRYVLRPLMQYIGTVLAQDQVYAARFGRMGVRPGAVRVTGNIKSRVVVRRPSLDQWQSMRGRMSIPESSTVVTAGCIHGGEAAELRKAIDSVREHDPSWKWIVVPRHLDDADEIVACLGPGVLRTNETSANGPWQVCVVEKYGVLEDLYRIADAAVVGGTFIEVGGHSMWEPAQFGIPVFWGPYAHTQRESCEHLSSAGVGFAVSSGPDLGSALMRVLRTEARGFIAAQKAFCEAAAANARFLEHAIP